MELLEKINSLLEEIEERLEELRIDLREQPNPNVNHMASMIVGEIDGLKWVKDKMRELQI